MVSKSRLPKSSETDWPRLLAMKDEEIDTSDMPPITREQLRNARWVIPEGYVAARIAIEGDLADWLAACGESEERVINNALREYRERHPQSA